MKKKIEIKFDFVTGEISLESSGFKGNACSLDVNNIMKKIGKVTKRKMKRNDKDRKVLRHQKT